MDIIERIRTIDGKQHTKSAAITHCQDEIGKILDRLFLNDVILSPKEILAMHNKVVKNPNLIKELFEWSEEHDQVQKADI